MATVVVTEQEEIDSLLDVLVDMDACFAAFDKNGDGKLDIDEFRLICRALFRNDKGKIYTLEENKVRDIFGVFDQNSDGFIGKYKLFIHTHIQSSSNKKKFTNFSMGTFFYLFVFSSRTYFTSFHNSVPFVCQQTQYALLLLNRLFIGRRKLLTIPFKIFR